jgi:hypothetical protein
VKESLGRLSQAEAIDEIRCRQAIERPQTNRHAQLPEILLRGHLP